MRRKALFASLFSFFALLPSAYAHCPLCTAATGMAVATTRVYGVDDLVTGTFIGAFVLSTALWLQNVLRKRNLGSRIPLQTGILSISSLAATLIPLYATGLLTFNQTLFGMDRIVMGTLIGTAITALSFWLHRIFRMENGNRNYLPFQGIILPLLVLVFFNAVLYFGGVLV